MHLAEDGWFWMIPLPGEVMSVGFVGTQRAFKERHGQHGGFPRTTAACSPTVSGRMTTPNASLPVTGAGNYSYEARQSWGGN